jgi:hypothetical protein
MMKYRKAATNSRQYSGKFSMFDSTSTTADEETESKFLRKSVMLATDRRYCLDYRRPILAQLKSDTCRVLKHSSHDAIRRRTEWLPNITRLEFRSCHTVSHPLTVVTLLLNHDVTF